MHLHVPLWVTPADAPLPNAADTGDRFDPASVLPKSSDAHDSILHSASLPMAPADTEATPDSICELLGAGKLVSDEPLMAGMLPVNLGA